MNKEIEQYQEIEKHIRKDLSDKDKEILRGFYKWLLKRENEEIEKFKNEMKNDKIDYFKEDVKQIEKGLNESQKAEEIKNMLIYGMQFKEVRDAIKEVVKDGE